MEPVGPEAARQREGKTEMRITYTGVNCGRPEVEINGWCEELWVEDMGTMDERATQFSFEVDGQWPRDGYAQITDTDRGIMWTWKVDLGNGDIRFTTRKTSGRRR